MNSRCRAAFASLVAAGLVSAGLAAPAGAQVQSSGLGDVDAWGASYLERGEAAFDEGLWTGSDGDYLLALMESIEVEALSPAQQALLSRALRSPAGAPGSDLDDMLLQERLRLLLALGERREAARLASQMSDLPEGINPDIILSDARLARGELELVCAQKETTGEGLFWAELRALCAIADDAPADFMVEIAGQQEGAEPWFTNVALSVMADEEERPAARYGSGLEIAVSDYAGLEPDAESLSADRPDLAALIAADETRPLALRIAAAGLAAEAGELPGETHRALYRQLVTGEDFEPSNAVEAAFVVLAKEAEPEAPALPALQSRPAGPVDLRSMNEDWIEPVQPEDPSGDALDAAMVDEISLAEEQSLAVSEALHEAATGEAAFAARARLFENALDTIPAREDTKGQALLFAAASLAARNVTLADKWLDVAEVDAVDAARRFDFALLEAYAPVLGGERREQDAGMVARELVQNAVEPDQQAAAMQAFSVWTAFDMPVPVVARQALVQADLDAERIPSGMLAAIQAAERNDAAGEALLTILTQTDEGVSALSGGDLAVVLGTLWRLRADTEAKALAFEVAALWRLGER